MDSVTFCGQTCHTVMQPEYTAYQDSPHSKVECVKCHIGPGASWFVQSKLSGVGQVFAVTFNTYPRPIPTPVHNLRPARETCEQCHWPQKYGEDRIKVITHFAEDENNTATKDVLLMKIGGGNHGIGIHGTHLGLGVRIRYRPSDEARQTIPWVEYDDNGRKTVYAAAGAKPDGAGHARARDGLHGLPQPPLAQPMTCRSARSTRRWPPARSPPRCRFAKKGSRNPEGELPEPRRCGQPDSGGVRTILPAELPGHMVGPAV